MLLSLAAAAQGELWDGVPTVGAAPRAAVPPPLNWGQHPNSEVAHALLTQLLAQGHTRITQPNQNTQTPQS